jgi:hypothetical protein
VEARQQAAGRKKYERAIESMREAYDWQPTRLGWPLELGAALFLTLAYEEAITHLRTCGIRSTKHHRIAESGGVLRMARDDGKKACDHGALVSRRPQWKDAPLICVAYYKTELYDTAADELRADS